MSATPPRPADRYAVLGHPVAHSKSPAIQAAFAAQTGARLTYERIECPLAGFGDAVRAFAASGARGCNVTVPFKFEALALAGSASDRARLAGAANVLSFDGPDPRDWRADNSDGIGLVRDIEANAGVAVAGTRVLLIGAGGAAAGVLGPLIQARPASLLLVNRTASKAVELARRHAALADACGVALATGGLDAAGADAATHGFDLVLNASASSLAGNEPSPVAALVLRPGTLALDLMYGAAAEPFMAWAQAHGATPRDGLGMLVEQAAEAFCIWRGQRPQTAPVLAALRDASTRTTP
ncbi:MAG: shikimate dehydrogenase [Rubrivivax sp.]|jgi:shikimate dehydrogenase